MPTFTAIALDRLLDPGASSRSADKSRPPPKPKPIPKPNLQRKILRPNIKPGLYTTPEATPLPDSPTSFPPSPYIINHKRRGPRLMRSLSGSRNGVPCKDVLDEREAGGNGDVKGNVVHDVEVIDAKSEEFSNGLSVESDAAKRSVGSPQRRSECGDLYESRDLSSAASDLDNREDPSSATQAGEFYDAWDELSSDGGTQSSIRDIEAELREMRLSLFMEIESRKQAEEALNNMRKQWEKIRKQFLGVGLTLPADPVSFCEDNKQLGPDPMEELFQQITVVRHVSESIGRGIAKAEAKLEMEAQLESKNFEIARLTDRLNYYEAMNHEMSQRNQEAIEMARRNRQERKRKQKWIWGSIASAITIGTGALLWSYVSLGRGPPSTNHLPLLEDTDSSTC